MAEKSRRERVLQGAIAGQIVQEQAEELQDAGVVAPEELVPAAADAGVVQEPVFNLDDAVIILQNAAAQAENPAPLHAQIVAQAANARRADPLVRYTLRQLMGVFITLALSYYSSFPIHAAPRETSFFDAAASHLSTAGTVTGFMSLPVSGILSHSAAGVKLVGKMVRNRNAALGRYPNSPAEAMRRKLNVMEYDPTVGSSLSMARLGALGASAGLNVIRGKPKTLYGTGMNVLSKTTANAAVNLGEKLGLSEAEVMARVERSFM